MSEEIKNRELKETELKEEDLEKVSGGGAIYNSSPVEEGIGGGDGMGSRVGDVGMNIKGVTVRRNH